MANCSQGKPAHRCRWKVLSQCSSFQSFGAESTVSHAVASGLINTHKATLRLQEFVFLSPMERGAESSQGSVSLPSVTPSNTRSRSTIAITDQHLITKPQKEAFRSIRTRHSAAEKSRKSIIAPRFLTPGRLFPVKESGEGEESSRKQSPRDGSNEKHARSKTKLTPLLAQAKEGIQLPAVFLTFNPQSAQNTRTPIFTSLKQRKVRQPSATLSDSDSDSCSFYTSAKEKRRKSPL